ncbi:serine/threonine protein kinase [Candidatus Atribacteria bacterium HGW-Atribacteria-1]|nr:MAG: serine/threonine protein kinase [Candidatus Atribacteria bacterium HGW-Atribacteria-1]
MQTLSEITEEEIKELILKIPVNLKLLDKIGKGGQKQVYKAIDQDKDYIIVFKVIRPNLDIERVKREIIAVKTISHQHIPKIYNSNVESINNSDEIIWIIEEFIEGESLRDALKRKRSFNLGDIVLFIDTMLSILEKSEACNIIHRDIKPENIIIDTQNKYWLIDFGIARHLELESLTESNSPFGPCTIGYSAAEQFRNRKKEIDIRADLFSLGVVVAEIIIGYNPYLRDAKDVLQIIKNIENQPLPLLRIEGDSQFLLARFIKTLGDNRISRRPRTAKEAKQLFNIVKDTLKI